MRKAVWKRNEGKFQDKQLSIKVRDLPVQDGQLKPQAGRKNRTKLNGWVVFELDNRHTSNQLEHLKKTWNGHTEN